MRYSEKRFAQIYKVLYGDAIFVSLWGAHIATRNQQKHLFSSFPSNAFILCFIIIIGRLQSRRLRASSSHKDPVPNQTACPRQSCCLCLPKGVECIWETGFVAFLVFSSHVVEYTVRTPCMAHHQASWVNGPETSVGRFWHFLLAGQSELNHRF